MLFVFVVGEHIPVKQGLRLSISVPFSRFKIVGEHIPVKQGLRLPFASLLDTV